MPYTIKHRKGRYVGGEGPTPCDLAFVGEAPGIEEDQRGRPFIGKTGLELERYLRRALRRSRADVYLTNLVKRLPEDGKAPSQEMIDAYSQDLVRELAAVSPSVVVCLGRCASRFFLGDVDMETVHGMAVEKGGRIYFPAYHPAAGLHNTEIQGLIAWDFERLRMLLNGEIEPGLVEDEHPEPNYWRSTVDGAIQADIIAVDTEGSSKKPWGLSWATVPGTATVECAGNSPTFQGRIVLHNSMYDLGVLRAMGIELADDQFDDTMVMAYLLCLESQGLKPLAKRHCGMEMSSYDEIISPATFRLSMDYLWGAWEWLNSRSNDELKTSSKTAGSPDSTRKSAGKRSGKTSRKK